MSTPLLAAALGDVHLDSSPSGRLAEAERVCNDAIDDMARRGVDLLTIAGDLFQHTRSNAIERNAAVRIVRRAAEHFPVIIVRGNHDGLGELDFLRHIRATYKILVEDGFAVHEMAGIAVACAAWPCKASLLAGKDTSSARTADKALLAAFREKMDRLDEELAKHHGPKMLVAHAMVRGSTTSVGQPLVGVDLEVGVEDIRRAGAPINVLAHVHKEQDWRDTLYVGSPRPTDFGDLDDKSYTLIHFDGDEPAPSWWRRIPTTATPLHVATAAWDGASLALDGSPADHAGAEVQLRYTFPAAHTPRVAPQAAALRAAIEAAGAKRVHLAPKKIATVEARAPQVSEARTLAGKLDAFYALHGEPPNADRKRARLHDLDLAASVPKPRPGWVRYRRLRMRGVRPFRCEVDIDLAAIDARTIALVGENGEGKSTILEAFASIFPGRRFKTHGTAASLVADPEAFIEVTFDCAAGEGLTVRQTFAPKKKNGKAGYEAASVYLLTADEKPLLDSEGNPVLPGNGPAEYDAWAKANLPHPTSYFAHSFLAQDRQSWLDLDDSPRKGVLLRVAGVEYLEALAKIAGERERTARSALATLSGKCDELRRALGLPELYGDPKTPRTGTVLYQTPQERRSAALMAKYRAGVDVEVEERTLAAAEGAARLWAQRQSFTEDIEQVGREIGEVDRRIAEQREKQAQTDEIARAEREKQVLGWRLEGVDGAIAILGRERAALDILLAETITIGHSLAKERGAESERRVERRRVIDQRLKETAKEAAEASAALAKRRALLSEAPKIRAAVVEAARLDTEIQAAKRDVAERWQAERDAAEPIPGLRDEAQMAAGRARAAAADAADRATWPALVRGHLEKKNALGATLADLTFRRGAAAAKLDVVLHVHERRATALREAIDGIAWGDHPDEAPERAQEAAATDDERIQAASKAGVAADLKAEVALLDQDIAAAHRADATERLPDGVPADERAAQEAAAQANADRDAAELRAEQAARAVVAAEERFATAKEARVAAEQRHDALRTQREAVAALAAQAPELASAEERVAELAAILEKLAAEEAALRAEHATLAPLDQTAEEKAVAARKQALTAAKAETIEALAAAEQQRETLLAAIRVEDSILAQREGVAAAGALLAEMEAQRALLAAEEQDLRAKLADVPEPLTDVPTVESARAALDSARAALATEQERAAVVDKSLAALAEREAEREGAVADVEDWEHLAFVLGRNGIQADEVDAIGPRVAGLATTYLHECYGTGWTVAEIDTVGSCDSMIAVADEEGDPRSDRTFSPGQRGILAGAHAMAIATIECQAAAGAGTTLMLDEAGRDLSASNNLAWARMIRKAVEIVGADKAIYISHDEGAQGLADARVMVTKDRVWVE